MHRTHKSRPHALRQLTIVVPVHLYQRIKTIRQVLKQQGQQDNQRYVFNVSKMCALALERAVNRAESELHLSRK